MENLNIKGMIKNHKLAKSISDCCWGMFVHMLKYKAEWHGINIIKIGRFDLSSLLIKEIIKNHVTAGYDILKDIDFKNNIAQIVYQHHERNDGSGYPRGLTSKYILTESFVLIVSDVVSSMLDYRPYRPSIPVKNVISYLNESTNILYNDNVVKTVKNLLKEKSILDVLQNTSINNSRIQ